MVLLKVTEFVLVKFKFYMRTVLIMLSYRYRGVLLPSTSHTLHGVHT